MEKISGFQITGLRLSGFKSFSQPTELRFGNPTVITGGNGRGKSSIADAIAYAVTGLPFFAERNIDRLHSESDPELFVTLRFVDDKGVSHELTRSHKGSRTGIVYDGQELRQLDLTEMFGEKDVFLSIFNPLYFIEELGEDGKNLLQRYLPMIPQEKVLAELSDPIRQRLPAETLMSPEGRIKQLRKDIRELENSVIYLQGQQDLALSQQKDGQTRRAELEAKRNSIQDEKQALEAKRYAGIDTAELESTLTDLSAQYSELFNDNSDESGLDELDARLYEQARKLAERSASVYESKFTQAIAAATERVKALGAKYNAEVSAGKAIVPGFVCPTCRRAVSEEDVPVVRRAFQQSVSGIVAEGKEQRVQLEELKAMDAQSLETFQKFKEDDIAKLQETVKELTEQRGKLLDSNRGASAQKQAQLEELRTRMQTLTSDLEYGNLSAEEYDRMKACGEELRQIEAELSALKNTVIPSEEKFEAKIQAAQKQIAEQKEAVGCLLQYIAKRVELTLAELQMNRVSISLYDVVKSTGEVKDVFRFEYSGRRYDRLSLSEKIRAGMEVSELMKRLTGRNYPVFVDNMESVDDLNNIRPTGQVLMAKCVRNAELNIRAVKPIVNEMPMAA
ncbi:MAG: AAA family ATPase [Oscillospiraceae bacterium]|nr:AAA family ATPase [Oscillospiraceae bacterium]